MTYIHHFVFVLFFSKGLETNGYHQQNPCYKEIYGTFLVLCEGSSPYNIKWMLFLDGYATNQRFRCKKNSLFFSLELCSLFLLFSSINFAKILLNLAKILMDEYKLRLERERGGG